MADCKTRNHATVAVALKITIITSSRVWVALFALVMSAIAPHHALTESPSSGLCVLSATQAGNKTPDVQRKFKRGP
ncbi:MAG TPA: hypothetical protein VFV34_11810, partial [Blastocatellia bacterium]|nr:hypothetical protein [Blastocatellia bacterium]